MFLDRNVRKGRRRNPGYCEEEQSRSEDHGGSNCRVSGPHQFSSYLAKASDKQRRRSPGIIARKESPVRRSFDSAAALMRLVDRRMHSVARRRNRSQLR